jgi:hypothetical protein
MVPLFSNPPVGLGADVVERRRCLRQLLGLGALGLAGCASKPPITDVGPADAVAPFSAAPSGGRAPTGWQPYVIRKDKTPTQYSLVPDNNRTVLRARASAAASGLRCSVRIDPRHAARLRFSWRVQPMPGHASVGAPESDDCPARVILAFDGNMAKLSLRDRLLFDQVELFTGHRVPYATLMYVWDGALPPETIVHNHRTSRVRYLTVESGTQRCGRWLHYERDVVADFQRVFGEAPGIVTSVGVLTDSDATQQDFQAWYGDISLSRPRGA